MFKDVDVKIIEKFEKDVTEMLSEYLINSATEQGLLDKKMRDYIIKCI